MKWPESLVVAALCVVANALGYSKGKNVGEDVLLRALEKQLLKQVLHGVSPKRALKSKKDLLQELVRRGYLKPHGGRPTYQLTDAGLLKALQEYVEE